MPLSNPTRRTAATNLGCERRLRNTLVGSKKIPVNVCTVDIFGADVVAHYLNAARVEQETYDAVVHAWDRERYLERG